MSQIDLAQLPEGCKHLYGALFIIPFESLCTPDKDNGELEQNPRVMTEKGQNEVIDKKLSANLRENIKVQTLLNPLICRWVEKDGKKIPFVLGGDRRYRALDFLRRKKEIVTDPRDIKLKDQSPADEAYFHVPCQVFSCESDLEARALAWAENKNRINLTEGHEVSEVITLRRYKASDEKILSILQQDAKWLKDTDALISSLDPDTLADLIEGRLDRSAALELSQIEDIEVRSKVRVKANEASQETYDRKIKRLQKQVLSALDQKEIAEGTVVEAEFNENEEKVETAQKELNEADAKIKRIVKKRDSITPVTNLKNVRDEEETAGVRQNTQRVLRVNHIKLGADYVDELIANDGECPEKTFVCDPDALRLVKSILNNNILGNDPDFAGTIKRYAKSKR